jgi:hypothetical protein
VDAENSVTSRYLQILVQKAAEPVSPQRPDGRGKIAAWDVFHTVEAATWWPSPMSSPGMRR